MPIQQDDTCDCRTDHFAVHHHAVSQPPQHASCRAYQIVETLTAGVTCLGIFKSIRSREEPDGGDSPYAILKPLAFQLQPADESISVWSGFTIPNLSGSTVGDDTVVPGIHAVLGHATLAWVASGLCSVSCNFEATCLCTGSLFIQFWEHLKCTDFGSRAGVPDALGPDTFPAAGSTQRF